MPPPPSVRSPSSHTLNPSSRRPDPRLEIHLQAAAAGYDPARGVVAALRDTARGTARRHAVAAVPDVEREAEVHG